MSVITVDAVTKEPRIFQGRQQWGVKLPNGEWISMECGFRPRKGETFDVAITETSKNGKTYKNATIVGPAPAPTPVPPPPPTPQASVEAQFNALKPNSYGEAPRNSKIPWADWILVTESVWETAVKLGMSSDVTVGWLQTTLVTLRDGKLETPVEAGPVSNGNSEAKEDDIPW